MPSIPPKSAKQTLAIFSLSIAWFMNALIYSIYLGIRQAGGHDIDFMLAWSAMFVFVAWLIFIIFPIWRLNPENAIFKPFIFPIISGVYAVIVYSILLYALFRIMGLVWMYMPFAAIIGIIFGLSLSLLLRSQKLNTSLRTYPALKLLSPLSPFIFVAVFYIALPAVFPETMYRFMPEVVQQKIEIRYLEKVRVGDTVSPTFRLIMYKTSPLAIPNDQTYSEDNGRYFFEFEVENNKFKTVKFKKY